MNGAELMQAIVNEMHGAMVADVKDLTQEQVTWKPAPGANPIGFIFWHYVRTEDNIIHSMIDKPAVWETEQWYDKLGLDAKAQGTGFQEPDVDRAASLPLIETLAYAERVFEDTAAFLDTLDDARLDHAPNPERPRRNWAMMLRNFVIAHGWWHLGEIKYLKGLQGMPGAR